MAPKLQNSSWIPQIPHPVGHFWIFSFLFSLSCPIIFSLLRKERLALEFWNFNGNQTIKKSNMFRNLVKDKLVSSSLNRFLYLTWKSFLYSIHHNSFYSLNRHSPFLMEIIFFIYVSWLLVVSGSFVVNVFNGFYFFLYFRTYIYFTCRPFRFCQIKILILKFVYLKVIKQCRMFSVKLFFFLVRWRNFYANYRMWLCKIN